MSETMSETAKCVDCATTLTRQDVADIFGVNGRTVDRWLRSGELRRADTRGGIVRIPRSESEHRMRAVPTLTEAANDK